MACTPVVIGGVDTHNLTHHAAVVDEVGRIVGSEQFDVSAAGYKQLLDWLRGFGRIQSVGIEGTGSYGAGLCNCLMSEEVAVVEVDRPDRKTRRQSGKSDPIDAEAAARAVLAGTASAMPKDRTGVVESIRVLRCARAGALKAETAAINCLRSTIVTAPAQLRASLTGLSKAKLTRPCAQLRPARKDGRPRAGNQASFAVGGEADSGLAEGDRGSRRPVAGADRQSRSPDSGHFRRGHRSCRATAGNSRDQPYTPSVRGIVCSPLRSCAGSRLQWQHT